MRYQSAQDLKHEITRRVIGRMASGRRAAIDLGVPGGRVEDLDSRQPSIALGIVPGKGDRCQLAVRVQRSGAYESGAVEEIRRMAAGEVDVRYIGIVTKHVTPTFLRARHRPTLLGTSIAHFRVTAGSLTAIVELVGSDVPRLLSCNHILADENRGARGDAILQPGALDGGRRPRDAVGTLGRSVALRRDGINQVDCALAAPRDGLDLDRVKLTGSGRLMGLKAGTVAVGEIMSKLGRTSGLTDGRVTAVEIDNLVISYDIGNLRFDDQLEIEGIGPNPFSRPGDSGALVYTKVGRRAVGMIFAGSGQGGSNGRGLSFANPIRRVLGQLDARLSL